MLYYLYLYISLIHSSHFWYSYFILHKVIDVSPYHLYYIHTAADIAIIQFHLITLNTVTILFSLYSYLKNFLWEDPSKNQCYIPHIALETCLECYIAI